MIKLIAIDLDDTLLNHNKEISKDNLQAIKKALNQGIKIVIASGRPYFRVQPILKELGLNNNSHYVITYNGGRLSNGNESVIFSNHIIKQPHLNKITDLIESLQLHYTVYQECDVYATSILDAIRDKPVFRGLLFKIISSERIKQIGFANKVIVADTAEAISDNREKIEEVLASDYNILRSTPNFLEILPKAANKGLALCELSKMLNLEKDEVMAIGDEENDLSMFKYAWVKIAMGNANPLLKKEATFITLDQENSGVAVAINKYI